MQGADGPRLYLPGRLVLLWVHILQLSLSQDPDAEPLTRQGSVRPLLRLHMPTEKPRQVTSTSCGLVPCCPLPSSSPVPCRVPRPPEPL